MRKRSGDKNLSVHAIAGTHVVLLGINAPLSRGQWFWRLVLYMYHITPYTYIFL